MSPFNYFKSRNLHTRQDSGEKKGCCYINLLLLLKNIFVCLIFFQYGFSYFRGFMLETLVPSPQLIHWAAQWPWARDPWPLCALVLPSGTSGSYVNPTSSHAGRGEGWISAAYYYWGWIFCSKWNQAEEQLVKTFGSFSLFLQCAPSSNHPAVICRLWAVFPSPCPGAWPP